MSSPSPGKSADKVSSPSSSPESLNGGQATIISDHEGKMNDHLDEQPLPTDTKIDHVRDGEEADRDQIQLGHVRELPNNQAVCSTPPPVPNKVSDGLSYSRVVATTVPPPSPESTSTIEHKGKGKQLPTTSRANHFPSSVDHAPSSASRGQLDPRSSSFTPLRHLDYPAAPARDNRVAVNHNIDGHVLVNDPSKTHRSAHSRTSISSNSSTHLSTPGSQLSFPPTTPSSFQTWSSSAPHSASSLYTPHSSVGDHGGRSIFADPMPKSEDVISQEEVGRFLLISNVPPQSNGEQLRQVIQNIVAFKAIIVKHLKTKGWVVVAFYDSRNAKQVSDYMAVNKVRFFPGDPIQLRCANITPASVRQIAGVGEEWDQIWRDSESTIKVELHNPSGVAIEGMRKCLSTVGELKKFIVHEPKGKVFTADYWDTRRAADAIRILNGQQVEGGTITVRYLTEDPFHSAPVGGSRQAPSFPYTLGSAAYNAEGTSLSTHPSFDRVGDFNTDGTLSTSMHSLNQAFGGLGLQSDAFYSSREQAPWAMAPVGADYFGRQVTAEPAALQGMLNNVDMAARARRRTGLGPHWNPSTERQAIPPENRVFPERIAAGLDQRTTVMIKDVPNKLSRQELVGILNDVVPNEFDFMYLRFDFNNHCNVGYAFVNFTSCKALLAFIHAKVGKKWNMFSSEKVLQVSYANIQGKAALVNKFRNSAVMDVIEEWRPQIFYSSGALKGKPEPFPESDNPGRHRSTMGRLSFLTGEVW